MKRTLALLILLSSPLLHALIVEDIGNKAIFGIQVEKDRQEFYGRITSVNSVSLQSYLTATYRVTEMTIDMIGSPLQLRLYHAGPPNPAEEAKRLQDKTGLQSVQIPDWNLPTPIDKAVKTADNVQSLAVFKEYPVTTHAKTIEYRVGNRDELIALYLQFKAHWLNETEASLAENEAAQNTSSNGSGSSSQTLNSRSRLLLGGKLFIVE